MDEESLPKSNASSSVRANSGIRMATAWLRRKYSMVNAGSALSTSSTCSALNRETSLVVAIPLKAAGADHAEAPEYPPQELRERHLRNPAICSGPRA